jgi:hypothetical protein
MNNKRYINLSKSEITDLTHLLRATDNHRERQRIQALLWSHRSGEPSRL